MSQIYKNVSGPDASRLQRFSSGFSEGPYYSDAECPSSNRTYSTAISSQYDSNAGEKANRVRHGGKFLEESGKCNLGLVWVFSAGLALVVLVAYIAITQNQIMSVEESVRELEEKLGAQWVMFELQANLRVAGSQVSSNFDEDFV